MAAHAKFLFDNPLDRGQDGRTAAEQAAARALETAREQARAEGVAEGRRQALAEADARLDERVQALAASACAILETLDTERERLAREAAGLAFAAARALAPALIAREPHGELDALFSECIANLANAPHLAVRVAPGDVSALRARLEKHAHAGGYDGRIVVVEEDGFAPGDCRIEWADGGMARSLDEMTALVRTAIERRYGPLEAAVPANETTSTPPGGDGDGE